MFFNREAGLASDIIEMLSGPPLRILLAITPSSQVSESALVADAIITDGSTLPPETSLEKGHGNIPRLAYLENDPENDVLAAQLTALMEANPQGIVLGNARNGSDLQRLDMLLSVEEAIRRLPVGQTAILAVVGDNPTGLLNGESFAGRTPRLKGLGYNADAPTHNSVSAGTLRLAREITLLAAANAGVPAFGWLQPDLSGKALTDACADAQRDGFAAVVTSQPAQVAAILATRDSDAQQPEEAR